MASMDAEFVSDLVPVAASRYSTYADSTDSEGLIAFRGHRGFGRSGVLYFPVGDFPARIAHREEPRLCIGYLKCYSGREFQQDAAEFTKQYPDVAIQIINGNHEELYDELRYGKVDLILSDQRSAFSDEYVNVVLTTSSCSVEGLAAALLQEWKGQMYRI